MKIEHADWIKVYPTMLQDFLDNLQQEHDFTTHYGKPHWDLYFFIQALVVRLRADCVGRKVGCVLTLERHIIATGYNGTPAGTINCTHAEGQGCDRCNDPERESGKGYDLCRCVHAEANAILYCAKKGIVVEGSIMYTTLAPCLSCQMQLETAGVEKVIYLEKFEVAA